MAEFQDHFTWSADNVRLHVRRFQGDPARPTLLCIPGLTRNARDFDAFAEHFAPRFPVVALSLRGRGESGYAPDPLTYVPLVYLADVQRLVGELQLQKLVIVGTSLGGIVGMLLKPALSDRVCGLVLNDIGPDIMESGLARIQESVGKGGSWPTWLHAARDLMQREKTIYPRWTLDDWLAHAKRLCRISREGRIIRDYDPGIAAPLGLPHANAALDLWLALHQWRDHPVLSIRGELSDILSARTQDEMARRLPGLAAVTIPGVGHAPTLLEAECTTMLESFLARCA